MTTSNRQQQFIRRAIELANSAIDQGGGPFGAVVVREGQIVGEGSNCVTRNNDPTAHAEVTAIRDACARLGQFHLSGCELYVNCQPCPMCLSAAYWAHIDRIYYAASAADAERAGFQDAFLENEFTLPLDQRRIQMQQITDPTSEVVFDRWRALDNKIPY